MEYLVVRFPRLRRVRIDGEFQGRTDELIELEPGRHTVTLGPPANFTPAEQVIILKQTSPLDPREVTFEPAE